ncbi:adenosylcobinamide-GDP ribazoletransferase [Haloechinothrix sp. YIM 98757]|uniref:Adenosylcobinamide-GDP ribazoletransferase n=1 Tax=Haloechinothrix aidingensis TaxID=2752311 RepID=A0A838ABZ0_9PSEU|nr:adenosylcobinamide-GDP ribazoletransferase [Haloechinothrix aidingensis]MBA0126705.1 adenosylcobinamide-GDP ribazoletransferase [Haloechinothrix aidingensis]
MFDPLRMAVGTLTALPVPAPGTIDTRVARRAMLLAPVAVVPAAVLAAALVWAGQALGLPAMLTATVVLAVLALASRGLHLDGLADTADGLSASYDRQRALEIMRRGDTGPVGAAALVLVLLAQAAALAGAITAGHGVLAAAVAVLASRQTLVLCCARGVPAARAGGLGGAVAGSVPLWQAALSTLAMLALAALGAAAAGLPPWRGALAAALAALLAGALLLRCTRRLGGITGDVLGACVEAATLGTLLALAV